MYKLIGIAIFIVGFVFGVSANSETVPEATPAGKHTHMKETKDAMKAAMKDVKEACHADVEKLCAEVKPGHGRIIKCMKEHQAELSETCKAEIEKKKEARKKN
jgi:hypothetical protein